MNKTAKIQYDVEQVPPMGRWFVLSLQHIFAMFGATILVPYLTGMSPAVALVASGIGTLIFLVLTKGQAPAYLGSSFAFITPFITATAWGGKGTALMGGMLAGIVYILVALLIKFTGHKWIMKLLPPIVTGPIIIVIGLSLANVAVSMATNGPDQKYNLLYFSAALVTLAATVIVSIFARGMMSLIPILIGIIIGYLYSIAIGIVDFTAVQNAKFFMMPDFMIPGLDYAIEWKWQLLTLMVPVAVVTLSEHIGHQLVLGEVIERDLIEKPGLHRSIMGDGLATFIASFIGGPPNTTYGENIGVLAITRVYSVFVLAGAAVIAIIFGFNGYVTALISSIPTPVMGGVSILLFGIIASSGLRMMVDSKIDFSNKRNLIIASVVLVIGIGGAVIKFDGVEVSAMALSAIAGVLLQLVLPKDEHTYTAKNDVK